jgi:hypothetical protein
MKEIHYATKVVRRRGEWHISVPALPGDAPVVVTRQLGNAAPLLIEQVAEYLGVSVSIISVSIEAPKRPARTRLRDRLSATIVQGAGGAGAVAGLYLLAGSAVTLTVASVAAVVLGALREAGKV